MYKALYPKIEIKAGGRVDRPSSRSVTSQLMLFEREDAQYSFVSWVGRTAFYGTYRVNKVRVKYITSFISSHHSDKSEVTYMA